MSKFRKIASYEELVFRLKMQMNYTLLESLAYELEDIKDEIVHIEAEFDVWEDWVSIDDEDYEECIEILREEHPGFSHIIDNPEHVWDMYIFTKDKVWGLVEYDLNEGHWCLVGLPRNPEKDLTIEK